MPAHWAVNFAVPDVDAFAEHARSLGGTVLIAPTDTRGFGSAVIADPQGASQARSDRDRCVGGLQVAALTASRSESIGLAD